MPALLRETPIAAPRELLARWHERPGAFERLVPPWEDMRVVARTPAPPGAPGAGTPIGDGARLEIVLRKGPLRLRWLAEHRGYAEGHAFEDTAVHGPFRSWRHTHRFIDARDRGRPGTGSILRDEVAYELPLGRLARPALPLVRARLERMFAFRHDRTRADVERHARYEDRPKLTVAVTGSHGFIGAPLVPFLTGGGHRVVRLVRGEAGPRPDGTLELPWRPYADPRDEAPALAERLRAAGVDAVVHLAARNIAAGRWNERRRREIHDSRERPTRLLAEALARMARPPAAFIQASGISGIPSDLAAPADDREPLAPGGGLGAGFLAGVTRAWEQASRPAEEAGVRTVRLRIGMVLGPKGSVLGTMLPAYRAGVAGPLGDGRQWWPWIALDDLLGVILFCLFEPSMTGVVHALAPEPVRAIAFHRTLARAVGPPWSGPRAPAPLLRAAFGAMVDEALLASARAVPGRLTDAGFRWLTPDLGQAIRRELWVW